MDCKLLISIGLVVLSYLYGSIPFALVIGKLFYKKDIRTEGSGNLGGTNAGRVLGAKAGVAVIILDASKAVVSMLFTSFIAKMTGVNTNIMYISALACVIGHCYPIFAGFRGGKAVSVAIGYILTVDIIAGLIGLLVFFIVLKLSKYVSLSSISGTAAVVVVSPFIGIPLTAVITNVIVLIIMVYKHKDNIQRLKDGTERKITWM